MNIANEVGGDERELTEVTTNEEIKRRMRRRSRSGRTEMEASILNGDGEIVKNRRNREGEGEQNQRTTPPALAGTMSESGELEREVAGNYVGRMLVPKTVVRVGEKMIV